MHQRSCRKNVKVCRRMGRTGLQVCTTSQEYFRKIVNTRRTFRQKSWASEMDMVKPLSRAFDGKAGSSTKQHRLLDRGT
jgi:hypothetical protein